jgi:N-methylhydantoinase A
VQHERVYGHRVHNAKVEMITARVIARAAKERVAGDKVAVAADVAPTTRQAYFGPDFGSRPTPVIQRSALTATPRQGPLIVEEYEGTTVIPPDCTGAIDAAGNIVIEVGVNQ